MGTFLNISVYFCLCVIFLFQEVYSDDEFVTVNTTKGAVKGKKFNPDVGISHYRFQGIPYAKPPVGNLRFKAPVTTDPWDGVYEALREGNICKQSGPDSSEDCLFLNVHTSELPDSGDLRPVMVWIHGGAFKGGSGNAEFAGPEYLVSNGVVYVSINYRLGALGFLNTEDEAAPGNAGMKDQVLALKWVQENIAAFGGDPDKVTIFGESAGSAAVSHHLLSPMSAGLFRAAISQSGSAANPKHVRENPRSDAFFLGNNLGFSGNSSEELVDFLRTVSADYLVEAQDILPEVDQDRFFPLVFCPSVETAVEGEESFLSDNPITLFEEGRFHNVPLLTGTCSSEGIYFSSNVLTGAQTPEDVDENFLKIFKPELRICRESACGDVMLDKIKEFYFGNQSVSNETLQNLVDMVTDMFFAEGTVYTIDKLIAHNTEPVFFYLFEYDGGLGYKQGNMMMAPIIYNISGTSHGDDLGYIFYSEIAGTGNSKDVETTTDMVTMWTNFAKTMNPTSDATEGIPSWLPYSALTPNYLDIDTELAVKTNFRKERMDFWKNLYTSN